jgi:hypothetical protein
MKIRRKTLMAGPEGVFPPGAVIDAGFEEAEALVAGGFAERVDPPTQPAPVETAAIEPGSRAMRPASRARKTQ